MTPGPTESLRASAAAYTKRGDKFSASLCARMAEDCAALGPIGDALYRHWASDQVARLEAITKQEMVK